MDQRVVADVIELRLHLLPIVRRHQRELLVQPGQGVQDAFVQLVDHVRVQQQRGGPRRWRLPPARRRSLSRAISSAASSGPTSAPRTRSAGVKPPKPPNQATVRARSLGIAGPEPFDAFEHFQVPAADLSGHRLQAPGRRPASASPTSRGRRTAGPRSPSPALRGRPGPGPIRPARWRRNRAARPTPMISAVPRWKRTGSAVLDRPFHVGQAVQPHRQHAATAPGSPAWPAPGRGPRPRGGRRPG